MADKNPNDAVEEPQSEQATNDEQRQLKQPENERWWENAGSGGEVH